MTDFAVQLHEPNRRLDAIDRKILTVLQEDASLSVAEIGDRVGLSSTPCWWDPLESTCRHASLSIL